jgi:hypothetical protein
MEIKSSAVFEIVKNERVFRLEVPVGAPLGDCYQVAGEYLDKFIEMINENAKMRKEHEAKSQEVADEQPEQAV